MINQKENIKELELVIVAKTIKGTSFVGIRNYENKFNEISNQTLLVGYDYNRLLKNDIERLKNFDLNPIINKYGKETVTKAYNELLTALEKLILSEEEKKELELNNDKTLNRSNGQKNAYKTLSKGIRLHENGDLYVTGLLIHKTIIKKGNYPKVNSRQKTLAKNEIKKLANLQTNKIRNFKFNNLNSIKLMGVEIKHI